MISDLIRDVSVAVAAGVLTAAAIVAIRWWRDSRKPSCTCWACRRMDKAPRAPKVTAELQHHFYLWQTRPAVEPDRERRS